MSEHVQVVQAWPRALTADAAARYCGLSVGTFRAYVRDGQAPAAVRYPNRKQMSARRVVWMREHLDAWLDRLSGKVAASEESNLWLAEDGELDAPLSPNLPR